MALILLKAVEPGAPPPNSFQHMMKCLLLCNYTNTGLSELGNEYMRRAIMNYMAKRAFNAIIHKGIQLEVDLSNWFGLKANTKFPGVHETTEADIAGHHMVTIHKAKKMSLTAP
ncbi:hypothetical protein HAX54_052799 [Datura stramonium]|uniref:Uncharacterized protein n=1 Tax=Datura stramonium TaxID=4076 RepID=A0ABS8WR35_DATST|nr:hypothetical protein [Datura stramonium]